MTKAEPLRRRSEKRKLTIVSVSPNGAGGVRHVVTLTGEVTCATTYFKS